MKLIDDYCLKILGQLEVYGESTFTELKISVKNKKTRSERLKFLLEKKLLIQKSGLYQITTRGKKLLKILLEAQTIIQEENVFESYDRVPYIFQNYLYSYVSLLKERFKNEIVSVVLYGSVARGKWTYESDIDLLLIFSNEISNKSELNKTLTNITLALEKKLVLKGGENNPIYCSLQEYPILLKELNNFTTLFYDIAMDGIILFDRSNIGFNFIRKIKQRIKNKKIKRIFISDKNFYWKRNDVQFGEEIEL